jgi:DNA recombination protein RmuC
MDTTVVTLLVIVAVALVGLLVGLAWFYVQTRNRMNAISERLIESSTLQRGTSESFGQIRETLGKLTEASRHMEQVGKEIAGLGDLLRAPKIRGGIGELFLGDLLGQTLSPDQYDMNHGFRSGERVDAVIVLKGGMVPVDAKFPLESFQRLIAAKDDDERAKHKREFARAVRGHINDIARKYILPDEGTLDFAFMYIPAENVYYETIIKDEGLGEDQGIISHALARRVIPVSPNSFYAYLQAIVLGLKGLQIEKQAQEIMQYLGRLQGDFGRFREDFSTLGGHVERARKKFEEASVKLGRFEEKLIGAGEPTYELPADLQPSIEGPEQGGEQDKTS